MLEQIIKSMGSRTVSCDILHIIETSLVQLNVFLPRGHNFVLRSQQFVYTNPQGFMV